MVRRLTAVIVIAGLAGIAAAQNGGRGGADDTPQRMPMRAIDTPYYILHTDVSDAEARETDLRMTRMFEEYQRRTASFGGQPVKEKFPFFLFRNERDYIAAGGQRGSAGVYMQGQGGKRLMAIAGEKTDAETWHVIQHEGFHQFAAAAIAYPLPAWANEGLAEYFGEAVWTGDGFVTGLIPPDRLKDVQQEIKSEFKPFKVLMGMSQQQWNDDLTVTNYDQAWSMIYFLAHADGGRYQGPFQQYMLQVSRGNPPEIAWANIFGADVSAFQAKYVTSWMALKDNPTRDGYMKALVLTETSFLARAILMKQTVKDPETFFKEYHPPEMGVSRDLWLPPELFAEYGKIAPDVGKWTLTAGPLPKLVLTTEDGATYAGWFTLSNGKVGKVDITITAAATKPGAGR